MKKVTLILEMEMTPEYCESNMIPLGKQIESGEFHQKMIKGIEQKLHKINAKLEISNINTDNI